MPIGLEPLTARFEVHVLGEELLGHEISALLNFVRRICLKVTMKTVHEEYLDSI